jgi:hypothetical protein
MTTIRTYLNTRTHRWIALALVLGVFLLALATCGPRRSTVTNQASTLPPLLTEALSRQPVWCFADFQNRFGRNTSLGYYPTLPLDTALAAPGAQDWLAQSAVKQQVRCYTSWEAAFHHHDGRPLGGRNGSMEQVKEWLPASPNEADYEIALLYGVFKEGWRDARNPAFSPTITPQPWALTRDLGTSLEPAPDAADDSR